MSLRNPACTLCPLHKGVKNVCIGGEGPLSSPILALGDAPGDYEDRVNAVYIGRAGQFLRACIQALGLEGQVRMEYAVRCRPENNRKPTADERKACLTYLEQTIAAMPGLKVIVAMGETAYRAVGENGSVLKMAGVPISKNIGGRDLTVVALASPAYLMHNQPYISVWEEHWRGVKGILTPPDAVEVAKITGLTEDGWFPGDGPLALDLETTHLEVKHASILCYSVSDGEATRSYWVDSGGALRRLRDLLGGSRTLIVHNAGFEGLVSDRLLGVRPRSLVDTMLLAARANPWDARSLAALTAKHLPEVAGFKGETDILTAKGVHYWELPRAALLRRNAIDAWATARLHQHYQRTLPADSLKYAAEDAELAMFMARVEERGLWMDEERMDALQVEAEAAKVAAIATIKRLTMHDINPGSGVQVGGLLEELGCKVGRSPAGNPITDERTLKEMTVPDLRAREVIEAILSYRGAVKLTGTYLKGYAERRDGDGYIRSSFRWPGTVSWRPTSSNPNILNVPRGPFRRVFAAPPGMSVVEGDMGQFQFREVAVLTQDPEMLAAIREGDPHGRLAGRYFGAGYTKNQRHHAKTCNFLMIFEGGPETLQGEFAKMGDPIDRATARRYWEEFHNLYQKVKPYWAELYRQAQGGVPVVCPTGGYAWSYKDALAAANGDSEAALGTIGNAQVQAVESRLTMRAGLKLEAEGIEPRLTTYDGLIAYADEKISLDAARRVRYLMEAEVQAEPFFAGYPFPAEAKRGDTWGSLETVD